MSDKNNNSDMTLDKLAQMMQNEFRAATSELRDFKSSVEVFQAETRSSIRALFGDVAEIKVAMEDQEHEKRIYILELEQRHQDGRLRKMENSLVSVK